MHFVDASCPLQGYVSVFESKFEFDAVADTVETVLHIGAKYAATFQDVSLTIVDRATGQVSAELDFEEKITACAWSASGLCAVVADCSGTLHLVRPDGTVIFSQKVSAGKPCTVAQSMCTTNKL
jgi:hypothetical protein